MKKIDLGRKLFAENIALARQDGKQFRKLILEQLCNELKISINAAASIYNMVKKENEKNGTIQPGEIGRDPAKVKRWGKKNKSEAPIITVEVEINQEEKTTEAELSSS